MIEDLVREICFCVVAELRRLRSPARRARPPRPRRPPARSARPVRIRRRRAPTIAPPAAVAAPPIAAPAPATPAPVAPAQVIDRRARREILRKLVAERLQAAKPEPPVVPPAAPVPADAPRGDRVVVVRIDNKPPSVALVVSQPSPGFYAIRLGRGGGRYSNKVRRVLAEEVLRDATPVEARRGRVAAVSP